MTDYPSQSPWGPHGPQVSVPSVTPNPTAPSPVPDYSAPQPSHPGYAPAGGGGGVSTGGAPAGGTGGGTAPALHAVPIGKWILNLSLAGAAVGCIVAVVRALILHTPASELGVQAVRYLLAGAAAGAGFPPAFRAGAHAVRAIAWIALAAALWLAALLLAGQADWLTRLR